MALFEAFLTRATALVAGADGEALAPLAAQRLQVLLYQGNPESAQMAEPWRRLTS